MIKAFHSLHLVKGYFRMALGAILPEFICMNILVTAGTFSKRETFKFLNLFPVINGFFMAKNTINRGMFSPQRESCRLMIKIWGLLKCFKIVTGGTIRRECSLVIICMTGETFLVKSQVSGSS